MMALAVVMILVMILKQKKIVRKIALALILIVVMVSVMVMKMPILVRKIAVAVLLTVKKKKPGMVMPAVWM